MYVPNSRNVPLFNGQGEFKGGVMLGTGIDVQGAVALTDNIGVMGSYSFLNETRNDPLDPNQTFKRNGKFFEGGLGYYKASRDKRVELYIGYGQGEGTTTGQYGFLGLGQQEVIVTGKYNRLFLQPSIGTNNSSFNIFFTPRISYVTYTEFQSGVIIEKPDEKGHLFFEPAATARFKMAGNLFGNFQVGLNVSMPNDAFFDHVPLQASIGVQLHLGGNLRTQVYRR
jgi:hypothetical protein